MAFPSQCNVITRQQKPRVTQELFHPGYLELLGDELCVLQ